MKVLIIYYSQTGNTGKIARAIKSGIEPLVEECDLVGNIGRLREIVGDDDQ